MTVAPTGVGPQLKPDPSGRRSLFPEVPVSRKLVLPALRRIAVELLVGALAGTLVLGLGGRLAMRAVALAGGLPLGFSVRGTLDVVLVGALYGAAGGLLYQLIARLRPDWRWARAAVLSVALFGIAGATSAAGRGALAGAPQLRTLVVALFSALFLAYGTVVHVLIMRWAVREREVAINLPGGGDAG